MHEADLAYDWVVPQTPLWEQVRGWFLQTLACAGVEERMGLRLYRCFVAAGFPAPGDDTGVGRGRRSGGSRAWGWANLVRGVMPLVEQLEWRDIRRRPAGDPCRPAPRGADRPDGTWLGHR